MCLKGSAPVACGGTGAEPDFASRVRERRVLLSQFPPRQTGDSRHATLWHPETMKIHSS